MARTPGRTPSKHVPFRGEDPSRGKKTGKLVPSAPRTSDGYEQFHQLIAHSDNYTPPQRTLKRKKKSLPPADDDDDEDGELSMELDSPLQHTTRKAKAVSPTFDDVPSPKRRKSIARMSAKELLENNEEEEDGGMEETPKYRKGKGKALLTPVRELDEEEEEEDDGMEDDIALGLQEAETYQSDDDDDEQQQQEETPPKKPKSTPAKPKAPKAPRAKWRQQEDDDEPEGVRRSKRVSYSPLEYWRGERIVYAPRDLSQPRQVPHIKEIVRVPKEPPKPLSKQKNGSHSRTRTQIVEREVIVEVDAGNPEAGWDDQTDTQAMVFDFRSGEQVLRRLAFTSRMFNPQEARVTGPDDAWSFEKIFGDDDFMAAGQLTIPPKKKKPSKASKDNTYIFYIVQGAINVTVGTHSLILAQGGIDREAKLFFTQARKVADTTDEADDEEGTPMEARLPSAVPAR
ncbi:hypothetical protein C8F01DRAFT_1110447 [Mycena amicta]|nr:hypothetical protein C8F01DRAFT_1110447 [Mycena amicta]